MDIESKIDEDRIVTIEKEPEVGDLVRYNATSPGYQDLETGVVLETWDSVKMFDEEEYPPYALVHWTKTEEEEEHPYEDLEVISA
jgi:hypothetical protein|tara:strand:- start:552 stop:806 length:255 start_codon:yes stop_codon:yes gene_type:complete